jgi:hypothetical protein
MKKTLFLLLVFLLPIHADLPQKLKKNSQAGKMAASRLAKLGDTNPSSTFFNINSWKIQMENQGFFQWNGTSHGSAGNYPKGMGSVIFAEGILWGVKVTDTYGVNSDGSILTDGTGSGLPIIRVNGSMYNTGLKAGKVLLDASGKIKTTGYSENYRTQQIWRVRKDFYKGDLRGDASILRDIAPADVTDAQMDADRVQYQHDWDHWPVDEGAPYDDVNGDGSYTPATWNEENKSWIGDLPGIPGADQTVWTVANDLPDEFTETGVPFSVSEGSWGSPPIGFEMQITLWGYDFPFSNPLSSMMFKRARMIYVGLPGGPATATLDTVYFTQWSDPDLGTHTDDYVGCDTTLSLGYVYNGKTFDDQFYNSWGSAVPAAGYVLLEGPKVDADGDGDLDTLGLSSFVYFAAGSIDEEPVSDPSKRVYAGTLQWFNLMEGFLPRPEYPTQLPFVDPLTGTAEKFVLAGDPLTGAGWIDGNVMPPGDRRLVMNTGPFQMALGDTQDIFVGTIGAIAEDNLTSLGKLIEFTKLARVFHNSGYDNKAIELNFAPIITALNDVTINEDETATVTLSATDEDGDAITFSVKDNNATKNYLNFDGVDDWVQTKNEGGDEDHPINDGDFTVSAWAKASSLSSGLMEIVSQGQAESNFYLGSSNTGDVIRAGDDWEDTGVTFPRDGHWHHYVLSRSSSNTFLYLDGSLAATKGSAIEYPDGGSGLRIGRQYGTAGEYFYGSITEVATWGSVLSALEVASLYNGGSILSPMRDTIYYSSADDVTIYYPLNEGTGSTVYGKEFNSSEVFTGEIKGGAEWTVIVAPLVTTTISGSTLTLVPDANWHGEVNYTVSASDGYSASSTNFNLTVTAVNDAPTAFDWVSTASDSIDITQSNLTDTYDLKWNTSNEVDGETIDYLISASVGQFPAEMIHETVDTSMTIAYQDIIDNWYPNLAMLSRATIKFSVSATDGIDTVNVTGDDRVVYVNRYEFLSTESEGIPTEFALHENYPNPFNPTTTLRFDLPEVSNITLTIYNMLGQRVRTFNMQSTPAGYHSVKWDATNDYGEQVGAGVYLYQLQTKDFVKTRKMVLLK